MEAASDGAVLQTNTKLEGYTNLRILIGKEPT
jgi:hypothetical protein